MVRERRSRVPTKTEKMKKLSFLSLLLSHPRGWIRMIDGLTPTPCTETVAPTPVRPMPTGAILTAVEASETPVTE